MSKKKMFVATSLSKVLIVILVLVMGLASAGFVFEYGWIKNYSTEVNQVVTSAHTNSGPKASVTTKTMEDQIAAQAPVITTLAGFYASPTDFQAKAIQDITTYAHDSNLSIGPVSLANAGATTTPNAAGTTATTTNTAASLTVKLNSPVSYTSLLKFITYIQNSLPKMEIQGLTIQRATSGNSDTVSIDSLVIQVVTQ